MSCVVLLLLGWAPAAPLAPVRHSRHSHALRPTGDVRWWTNGCLVGRQGNARVVLRVTPSGSNRAGRIMAHAGGYRRHGSTSRPMRLPGVLVRQRALPPPAGDLLLRYRRACPWLPPPVARSTLTSPPGIQGETTRRHTRRRAYPHCCPTCNCIATCVPLPRGMLRRSSAFADYSMVDLLPLSTQSTKGWPVPCRACDHMRWLLPKGRPRRERLSRPAVEHVVASSTALHHSMVEGDLSQPLREPS